MVNRLVASLAMVTGVGLLAGVVFANHDEPSKAKGLKMELVTGYGQCTAPDGHVTPGLPGMPACSPPVRNDPKCGFGGVGKGQFKAKVTSGDIKIQVKAKGITGCEGETFAPVLSFRVTADNCQPGSVDCTAVDLNDYFIPVTCTVTGGACKIKTTFNAGTFPVTAGARHGFEIHGCGLTRTSGGVPTATGPAFTCGLLVP